MWVNIYPSLSDDGMDLHILRRYRTEEEALKRRLRGCLGTVEIVIPVLHLELEQSELGIDHISKNPH